MTASEVAGQQILHAVYYKSDRPELIDIWKTSLFDTMALFPPNINAVGTVLTQHLEDMVARFERLLEKPGVHEKRDIHPFPNGNNFFYYIPILLKCSQQIEDWQEWIEDNLSTVQKLYPDMSSPRGCVVIGRLAGLSDGEKRRLARRNINLRGRLTIWTYDHLINSAKASIASLRKNLSRGTNDVQQN